MYDFLLREIYSFGQDSEYAVIYINRHEDEQVGTGT